MGPVEVVTIWAGLIVCMVSLAVVRGTYRAFRDEVERDAGWHKTWHERIFEDQDETDDRHE